MKEYDEIDKNIDMILKASGSALKNYTMPNTIAAMREVMRNIMSRSYIDGSNACYDTFRDDRCKP